MALLDMKVFSATVQDATIETLAQMVEKFNAASRGAIRLSVDGFGGDFLMRAMFASLHSAQRRVDRYSTNGTANATALSQIQHNSVKVAGGFGPILWEPAQLTWIQQNPVLAVERISQNMAEAITRDMLNTAIACAVAAIEAQGSAAVYDGNTGPLSYADINSAHAKFGDHSGLIVANVMDGTTYHGLIGQNLVNAVNLFSAQGVTVVDILGRAVIVTEAPALRETSTVKDEKVLGLVTDAVIVHDARDLITNIETSNGKDRIETTLQADYTFGLGIKGYAWDTSVKSPVDAELVDGSKWSKIATSIKHTAGVLALSAL